VSKEELFRTRLRDIHLVLSDRSPLRGRSGAAKPRADNPTAILVKRAFGPIVDEAARRCAATGRALRSTSAQRAAARDHPLRQRFNVAQPAPGLRERRRLSLWGDCVGNVEAWLDGKPVRVLNQVPERALTASHGFSPLGRDSAVAAIATVFGSNHARRAHAFDHGTNVTTAVALIDGTALFALLLPLRNVFKNRAENIRPFGPDRPAGRGAELLPVFAVAIPVARALSSSDLSDAAVAVRSRGWAAAGGLAPRVAGDAGGADPVIALDVYGEAVTGAGRKSAPACFGRCFSLYGVPPHHPLARHGW
jgi:hypothetical protein